MVLDKFVSVFLFVWTFAQWLAMSASGAMMAEGGGGADVSLVGDGNEMGGCRYERLGCRQYWGTRQLPSGWLCLRSAWYFLV